MNAGTYKRTVQKGHVAWANALLVAVCARLSACAEQVSSHQVNDNTSERFTIRLYSNRDGRTRKVVHEVRRAVDWVYDPLDSGLTSDGRPLFPQDTVVGTLLKDALYESPLGPFVCAGDWTPVAILEPDSPSGYTSSLTNAACNVDSDRDCNVEEFLSTTHGESR